jgi:hypothetical protein
VGKRSRTLGGNWILAGVIAGLFALQSWSQEIPAGSTPPPSLATGAATGDSAQQPLPEAPGQSASDPQAAGSIYGTVTDPMGNLIAGARVTLVSESNKSQQTALTDSAGFFRFTQLAAGTFRVYVAANGFAPWAGPEIALTPGRYYDVPEIALQIPSATTDVQVVLTRYELAETQIKDEEQQRILGVLPNFYTSYVWRAAPLTAGQKFRLAARTSIDPVTFGIAAATAGIEQSLNSFSGYGQGSEGYAKRFAASYADNLIDTMIGSAVLPSVLHQDPRYFYKGTGSISSRALYAISTVVMCRGDNGRWQPNYSNVAGNLISAGISNLYYPESNRDGAGVTIDNALIGTAEGAVSALLQEFVFKKISRGVAPASSAQQQPPQTNSN